MNKNIFAEILSKISLLTVLVLTLGVSSGFAKDCEYRVQRNVCPGKSETELLKPYGGKKELIEKRQFETEKECLAAAELAAKIIRPGQYSQKIVDQVRFEGKDLNLEFKDQKNCQ